MRKRNRYITAVDLWALGTVTHEVLTTHGPFQESWSVTDIDKASRSSLEDQEPQLDVNMIYRYCHGLEPFPIQWLKISGVEEAGIDFLKSQMAIFKIDNRAMHHHIVGFTMLQQNYPVNTMHGLVKVSIFYRRPGLFEIRHSACVSGGC